MAVAKVSEQSVRALADPRSFERGRAYFTAGRVRRFTVDGTSVTATVAGTSVYQVRLDVARRGLAARCSCPYGKEGVFCKHCVATALAWLDAGGEVDEARAQPVPDERLREFLLDQDRAWLVDELLAAARADRALRARLDVAAGAEARTAYDARALRARLERAIEIGDFVHYGSAHSYVQGVDDALDEVAGLVGAGFPDAAVKLVEYALELLDGAAWQVDDSDGGIGDAIGRAEEIHLAACAAGEPDPVALAESLVARALASDYEVFLNVLPDYEPILGPTGMARYRELIESTWRDLPPAEPHDYSGRRFVVNYLMEQLAESTGGADALIEVLSRNVTSGADVLRIAERLCADGRDGEALDWLERGLAEFPPDQRLRSLAADCHLRAGRQAEAGELLWANFAERPTLDCYVALREATGQRFPAWRERAIELLRAQPSASARFNPLPYPRGAGHSTLVEVLLWEGDSDAAWQAAKDGGCRDDLWLRLARDRASAQPEDAIPILLAAADQAIGHKNRDFYRIAARLLSEARPLFIRCDRAADFESRLAELRAEHRAKRALREELDKAGL
ncbi:putative Zn finger protein [Tamaricihabitans halophyticus]|uniref:Putative Zn finger protein n=1 Tax=Tamaricihabitans halophyticus TaxID=1262583 RepID=A0A4R2Q4R9_9PSEU|nr:DUF6880 family protein [Tamaricihabitans halophyticus]TCP43620.1 putative Zn finger protein [Tamaricihabitans halophyticus]